MRNGGPSRSRSLFPSGKNLVEDSRCPAAECRAELIGDRARSFGTCKVMNWEMLAAIGQLAAVLVGIPSLIYLATQIKHQTTERQQAAVNALTEQWGDLTRSVHDSSEMAEIFRSGLQSFQNLDAVAKLRFSAFFKRFMNVFEGMYFSHRQGILIDASWAAFERTLEDFVAARGFQEWWLTRKRWHTVEFAHVVDEMIGRPANGVAFSHFVQSS